MNVITTPLDEAMVCNDDEAYLVAVANKINHCSHGEIRIRCSPIDTCTISRTLWPLIMGHCMNRRMSERTISRILWPLTSRKTTQALLLLDRLLIWFLVDIIMGHCMNRRMFERMGYLAVCMRVSNLRIQMTCFRDFKC